MKSIIPRHPAGLEALRAAATTDTMIRITWAGGPPSYAKRGVVVQPATADLLVRAHDQMGFDERRAFAEMIGCSKGQFLAAVHLVASPTIAAPALVT